MNTITDIEKPMLAPPAVDREQLATLAWESLLVDSNVTSHPGINPGGIEIAAEREAEIELGAVQPIAHAEFLRLTGDSAE